MGIRNPCRSCCLFILIPLFMLAGSTTASPAEIWLGSRYAKNSVILKPIDVEWLFRRTTLRNPAEIRDTIERFADFPDHPELSAARFHFSLLDTPPLPQKLIYAGSAGWYSMETMLPPIGMPDGASAGHPVLHSGGLEGRRWMLYAPAATGGQLTVVKAGAPYPRSSDVSRYYEIARRRVSAIVFAGLPLDGVSMISSEQSGDQWWAVVAADRGGQRFRLAGSWLGESDVPIVTESVELIHDEIPAQGILFAEHSYVPDLNAAIPLRVEWIRSDSVLEEIVVTGIRRAHDRSVRAVAAVPDADRLAVLAPGARVVDFSLPDNPDVAGMIEGPMIIWTMNRGEDLFTHHEQSNHPATPGVGLPSGVVSSRNSQIAAIVVFVIGISIGIVWFRRRNSHP